MTAQNDLERQLNDFLRDGPEELPYETFDAVRERTEHTGQRVVFGPWRLPEMNKILTIGLAAAAVVVIGLFVGTQLLSEPNSGLGSDPPESTEPIATAEPTATPAPSETAVAAPPLTQSFTSTLHGISLSYPDGWIAKAATEPWTGCLYCTGVLSHPQIDLFHRPPDDDGLFLRIASQPIGESAPEDWVAAQIADDERCTTTEQIVVDGASGLSGGDTCLVAVVTTAGRGYHIDLWMSANDRDLVAQYDRAWFEEVLATVQLHPEDAVD